MTAFGYCFAGQGGSLVQWLPVETQTISISAGNAFGLPAQTKLDYADIVRHIVKAKPEQAAPAKPTDVQKWQAFVEASKIGPATIEAALGVKRPSEWLAAMPGKTIDDAIAAVKLFSERIGGNGKKE